MRGPAWRGYAATPVQRGSCCELAAPGRGEGNVREGPGVLGVALPSWCTLKLLYLGQHSVPLVAPITFFWET